MFKQNIILSLTTIKSRVKNLPKILTSILNKNILQYTIHIFYSNSKNIYDEGCSDNDLFDLMKFINKNNDENKDVKIFLSETVNIGPYRKLIPALKLYKDNIIITIDDDEIFENNIVDCFVETYQKHKCIICSIGRIIDIGNWKNMNDTINYYEKIFVTDKPYMNILPEGYGGILYHSNMFDDEFIKFDFNSLDNVTIKNDDIFFRYYTYNKNIPIYATPIYQSNIYNIDQTNTLFTSNKHEKISHLFVITNKYHEIFTKNIKNYDSINDINQLINLHSVQKNNTYKICVHTGTDVKKLQYILKNETLNDLSINLNKTMQNTFFNGNETKINTILINIEKDTHRYESSINEFKKLMISDFIHLKATYWKNTEYFVDDMNNVIKFLNNYTTTVCNLPLKMNIFSEFNDKNILIQDGPLACYCSHVRAMMYGYLNFNNYTIIVEDDFCVDDIEIIIKNLNKIPNDWDVICFGAQPINKFYDGDFYKFTDLFHSTQFYIIRNTSMEIIFKNIYPIYDQIDILLSKMHGILNIYNIPNSVLQKNFVSNTQNNLYVMYNSPNYKYIRTSIENIKTLLIDILCSELQINKNKYVDNIVLKLLFDVVFDVIVNSNFSIQPELEEIDQIDQYAEYFLQNNRKKLFREIFIVINSCLKGINVTTIVEHIVNDIYNIIKCFSDTSSIDNFFNEKMIPLNYGSTSNVYLLVDHEIVVKVYNTKLRWEYVNHNNSSKIMEKEIVILNKVQKIIKHTSDKIYMKYTGDTLFDNFILPVNWIDQLRKIFDMFNKNNIYYPEFNLKNITCKNDNLDIIDFGLAEIIENTDNNLNLINFIDLLTMFDEKFQSITNIEEQHVYYSNFINNVKMSNEKKYNMNIF
jgi:hypothetical protein